MMDGIRQVKAGQTAYPVVDAEARDGIKALFEQSDRRYEGRPLATVFESEIADYINGDEGKAKFGQKKSQAGELAEEYKGWLWMKKRIDTHNFDGIHVADWLPYTVQCTGADCNSCPFKTGECNGALKSKERHLLQAAGISTYRNTGLTEYHGEHSTAEKIPVPYHIDFISKDLLTPPIKWNTTATNCGEYCGKWICVKTCPNYSNRESCSCHEKKDGHGAKTTNCSSCGKNSTCKYKTESACEDGYCTDAGTDQPFCTSHVRKFLDYLFEHSAGKTLYDDIITPKSMLGERRGYQYSNTQLKDSTGWHWYSFGRFWLPTEQEVFGSPVWSNMGWGNGQGVQYPIFAGSWEHALKFIGPGGTVRSSWWEACAVRDSSTAACYVGDTGFAYYWAATRADIRVPVCFRIAASDNP